MCHFQRSTVEMKCHHLAELDGKSNAVTMQNLLLLLQWVPRNIVTQHKSTSVTWAWQLAGEIKATAIFLLFCSYTMLFLPK